LLLATITITMVLVLWLVVALSALLAGSAQQGRGQVGRRRAGGHDFGWKWE
jgi:hypothetical protein